MKEEDKSVLRAAFDKARVAHVGIDIQRTYCEPSGIEPEPGWFQSIARAVDGIADFTAATRTAMKPVWVNHTSFAVTGPDLDDCGPLRGIARLGGGLLRYAFSTAAQRARAQVTGHHAAPGDVIIGKPDFDGFHKTNLDHVLRARGADTLVLTGFFTDQCVRETALTARKKGYEVFVAEDLTVPGEDSLADSLRDLRRAGVRVARARDIVRLCA